MNNAKTVRCTTRRSFIGRFGFLIPTVWMCGNSTYRMTYWPSVFRVTDQGGTELRIKSDYEGVFINDVQRIKLADPSSFTWDIDGTLYRESRCQGLLALRQVDTSRLALAFADGWSLLGRNEIVVSPSFEHAVPLAIGYFLTRTMVSG